LNNLETARKLLASQLPNKQGNGYHSDCTCEHYVTLCDLMMPTITKNLTTVTCAWVSQEHEGVRS